MSKIVKSLVADVSMVSLLILPACGIPVYIFHYFLFMLSIVALINDLHEDFSEN